MSSGLLDKLRVDLLTAHARLCRAKIRAGALGLSGHDREYDPEVVQRRAELVLRFELAMQHGLDATAILNAENARVGPC